jgi:hypothetical protein
VNAFDAWCLAINTGHDVTPVFQFAREVGPGCVFAASVLIGWRVCRRTTAYVAERRKVRARRRQLRAERRQMAALSAAIDQAPHIPTRPGHDTAALNTCNAILRATQNREEKPQP